MIEATTLFHYGSLGGLIALPALGVGIGQGIAGFGALKALNQQPQAASAIRTTFFIALAFSEFAVIASCLMAVLLLGTTPATTWASYAHISVFLAIALPGLAIGLLSGFLTREALLATARQPFFYKKIRTIMILMQSMLQMPLIFGFIIGMLMKTQLADVADAASMIRLIAAGLTIGVGTLGPIYGLSIFARTICTNIGLNRAAYGKLFSFTLLSQAMIEAPILFALLIAFLIIQVVTPAHAHWSASCNTLAAALIICLGTIAPGLSAGRTAQRASIAVKNYPEQAQHISYSNVLVQTFINTNALFCMLLALVILLYV